MKNLHVEQQKFDVLSAEAHALCAEVIMLMDLTGSVVELERMKRMLALERLALQMECAIARLSTALECR